jgi:hypothetical protein
MRLDQQLGRDQVAGLEAEQVRLVGVERGAEPAQEPAARDRPVARPEAFRGARRQPDLGVHLLGPEPERVQATLDPLRHSAVHLHRIPPPSIVASPAGAAQPKSRPRGGVAGEGVRPSAA